MTLRAFLPSYYRHNFVTPKNPGGNYCFRGLPSTGKTLGMIRFVKDRLIGICDYKWSDVVANFHIWKARNGGTFQNGWANCEPLPGFRFKENDEIKEWVRYVYRKSRGTMRRQIIMIDEIDQVYSHRWSNDIELTNDILTLWQDQKMQNCFLYTKHQGKLVHNLIRGATEISIKPKLVKADDTLYLSVLDGNDQQHKFITFRNISEIYEMYDREEPVLTWKEDEAANDESRILDLLSPDQPVLMSSLYKALHMEADKVKEVVQTLELRGVVSVLTDPKRRDSKFISLVEDSQ